MTGYVVIFVYCNSCRNMLQCGYFLPRTGEKKQQDKGQLQEWT